MSTPRPPRSTLALRVLRRSRTVQHPSVTVMSGSTSMPLNARCRSSGRCPGVVSALAAVGVFATVLASYPVYGQPPQRGPRSSAPVSSEVESAHTQAANASEASERASTQTSAQASAAAPTGERPASERRITERRAPEPRVAPPSNPELHPAEPVRVAMRTSAPAPTTTSADAPDPAPTEAAEPAEPAAGRDPRRPPGKRTVIQDEFLVEGKLEKPSAYYILRRSSLDYDWARLDAKFSPLVLESVQDPLF